MECFSYLRNIQDLLSDGQTPYQRRIGEPFKDESFRLVHWLSITLFLRKTSQESINLESLTRIVPCIRSVRGENLEGGKMVADTEELETMDASEIYSKRLNAKEVIFQKQMKISFFQLQMDE